ncbi:MAG: hypothetical protein ACJAXN_002902 [Psychromonas sp.]|jgi:hypothetical protein
MLKLCNQLEFESKRKPRGVANVISEKHNTLAGNTGLLGKKWRGMDGGPVMNTVLSVRMDKLLVKYMAQFSLNIMLGGSNSYLGPAKRMRVR